MHFFLPLCSLLVIAQSSAPTHLLRARYESLCDCALGHVLCKHCSAPPSLSLCLSSCLRGRGFHRTVGLAGLSDICFLTDRQLYWLVDDKWWTELNPSKQLLPMFGVMTPKAKRNEELVLSHDLQVRLLFAGWEVRFENAHHSRRTLVELATQHKQALACCLKFHSNCLVFFQETEPGITQVPKVL